MSWWSFLRTFAARQRPYDCNLQGVIDFLKTQHHDDGVQDDNFETPEQRELRLARTTK